RGRPSRCPGMPSRRRARLLLVGPVDRAHDVRWPPTHLEVDVADVLADEPDGEDQHAEEYEEDREQREHALALRPDDQPPHEEERPEADAEDRHAEPDHGDELD